MQKNLENANKMTYSASRMSSGRIARTPWKHIRNQNAMLITAMGTRSTGVLITTYAFGQRAYVWGHDSESSLCRANVSNRTQTALRTTATKSIYFCAQEETGGED